MVASLSELKRRILKLLSEDEEFRYAIIGLIGLKEILKRLDQHSEELAKLREDMIKGFERHDKELAKLREDFNMMLSEIRSINARLNRVERTLERITISEEEEAKEVIGYRLRNMGIKIDLDRLQLPDLELNIYGKIEELCVIGEVTTRLGSRIVRELDEKVKLLSLKYPSYLRPKIIKVIYTIIATPEAVKEARKRGIWVLTWRKDLTKPPLA